MENSTNKFGWKKNKPCSCSTNVKRKKSGEQPSSATYARKPADRQGCPSTTSQLLFWLEPGFHFKSNFTNTRPSEGGTTQHPDARRSGTAASCKQGNSSLEFQFRGWTPPKLFPSDATATPAIVRMNIGARKQIRHSTGKILRFADAAPTRTSLARVIYQLALTWGGWVASRDSALKKKRELRGRIADTGNSRTDVVLATGHRDPLWFRALRRPFQFLVDVHTSQLSWNKCTIRLAPLKSIYENFVNCIFESG